MYTYMYTVATLASAPGALSWQVCKSGRGGAYSSGGRLLYISLFLERGALNDLASKHIGGRLLEGGRLLGWLR